MTSSQMLPEPEGPPDAPGRRSTALAIAVLVALGLGALLMLWVRRGGARRAITGLAEDGAVLLADKLLDEILPAA